MSNPNPFRDILNKEGLGTGLQTPDDGKNPFRTVLRSGIGVQPSDLRSSSQPGTEEFIRGVGRGALHPIRAFTNLTEPSTVVGKAGEVVGIDRQAPGLAGTVGELVGMGITFIPFFKGAQLVTGGVGILKGAPKLKRVIEGATSFGAFEAFGGEDVSEAPRRFGIGLAEGAAFELGLLKAASIWRGRFPREVPSSPTLKEALELKKTLPEPGVVVTKGKEKSQVAFHPTALWYERLFAPSGETLEETVKKLTAVQDPEANLYQAVVRIAQNHMPSGHLVLPAPTIAEAAQVRKIGRDLGYRVITFDKEPKTGILNLFVDPSRPLLKIKSTGLQKKFFAEGDPIWSANEAIKLLEEVGELRIKTYAEKPGGRSAGGDFSYPPTAKRWLKTMGDTESLIRLGWAKNRNLDSITDEGYVGMIVHEYMHYLHYKGATAVTGQMTTSARFNINQILDVLVPSRPGLMQPPYLQPQKSEDTLRQILNELSEATIWLRAGRYKGKNLEERLAAARKQFNAATDPSAKVKDREMSAYLRGHEELVARLAELMFLAPGKAKEVAPLASKLLARYIEKNSPKMKELMSREASAIDDILRDFWVRRGKDVTVWNEGLPSITAKHVRQFEKEGFYSGMPVLVDGKWAYFVGKTGSEKTAIRWAANGKVDEVSNVVVQRPLATEVAGVEKKLLDALDGMLETRPAWVAVNIRDGDSIIRSVVDLKDFEFVSGIQGWKGWLKGLGDDLHANFETIKSPHNSAPAGNINYLSQGDIIAARHVMIQRGSRGLAIQHEDGVIDLILASNLEPTLIRGDKASVAFTRLGEETRTIDGLTTFEGLGMNGLRTHTDDLLRSMLREQGVLEHDLPHYLKLANERLGFKIRELLGPETLKSLDNVEKAVAKSIDDSLDGIAGRAGLEVERPGNGMVELRDKASKSVLGRFVNEEEAIWYAKNAGFESGGPPIIDKPGISGMAGGNAPPPPPQSQMLPMTPDDVPIRGVGNTRFIDAWNFSAPVWSARENFAKVSERLGFGAVYNDIFIPLQQAMQRIGVRMTEPMQALGGRSFTAGMRELAGTLRKIPKGRQPLVTQYVEYLSKEEVASAGGLLQRAMTPNEIRVAKYIEDVGLATDVPRLMTTERLITSALQGKPKLDQTIRQLKKIETSPEVQQLINLFESFPKVKTRDDVIALLNITDEEKAVLKIIQDSIKTDKDSFSIMAVSRYASSRPLGKGYRTGREQFAFEQGMSASEVKAADQIDELLGASFGIAGIDAKRQVSGYWPHMRQWAKHGWTPEDMMTQAGGPKDMSDWAHDLFRTGELDVYEQNPLVTTYKYLHGMLMKQEFYPHMPKAKKALDGVSNERVHRVMSEYISELQGKPHESFQKLETVIGDVHRIMTGGEVEKGFVRNVVNSLSSLASSAALIFRPAVIARNYYETVQKVAPRVGFGYTTKAMKYVVSPETRKEAFEAALRAGAIPPKTQPIRSVHAAEELYGLRTSELGYKYQLLTEKGMSWYQSGDDWGRAIAFHAQKMRMADEYGKYMKGQQNFDKFLENSKALTFDPLDIQNAEKMIRQGDFEKGSDYLGWVFAREAMTRYGHANSPHGWNSVAGRMFGQFGTWPVQYKDFLFQGISRGTAKDRVEFAAIHFGVSGATMAAGYAAGVNLTSWVAFPSLFYTGGPFAGMSIDAIKSVSGSDLERSLARRNLYANIPILGQMETGNPRNIFIPGSYMLGDLWDAAQMQDPVDMLQKAVGFRVIKPDERTAIDWFMDKVQDPFPFPP